MYMFLLICDVIYSSLGLLALLEKVRKIVKKVIQQLQSENDWQQVLQDTPSNCRKCAELSKLVTSMLQRTPVGPLSLPFIPLGHSGKSHIIEFSTCALSIGLFVARSLLYLPAVGYALQFGIGSAGW